MFRVRSRITITHPSETTLVLRSNPGRRVLFGIVGALLLLAFVLSVDWQADFERGSLVGTIFYFVLTTTCLVVAAWGSSVLFDSDKKEIIFTRTIVGIAVRRDRQETTAVQAVTVVGVRFLKESERPQPGLLNTRFRNYIDRRNNYYKLYLDLGERRRFLEDSTDLTDLDAAANEISQFLHVTLRREEV
jgi:hypothetical protein